MAKLNKVETEFHNIWIGEIEARIEAKVMAIEFHKRNDHVRDRVRKLECELNVLRLKLKILNR